MLKYNGQNPTGPKAARVFLKYTALGSKMRLAQAHIMKRTAATLLSEGWGQNPGPRLRPRRREQSLLPRTVNLTSPPSPPSQKLFPFETVFVKGKNDRSIIELKSYLVGGTWRRRTRVSWKHQETRCVRGPRRCHRGKTPGRRSSRSSAARAWASL